MLVNKPADYLAQVRQQLAGTGRPEDVPIVFNRINDDLLVFYVFDTPDAMRTVMKSDLEKQRLDESSLHSFAKRNLGAYFDRHGLTVGRLDDTGRAKIYFVSLDDNYEVSVLLLDRTGTSGRSTPPARSSCSFPRAMPCWSPGRRMSRDYARGRDGENCVREAGVFD